ncbi:DUF5957 family protein [Halalkalibacter okhensis]|uniref:Uncharacterized protein n=1 Tax=Halalkalibacter okhensis TaxID=333138 RepID=A0A0B0I9S0_9BACI|nr:DUF5957 family protein [Halalkalibacter okhensis]KHF39283.1 hypothetical protein LQ50_16410 [Halalkalibacter okhensis]
MKMFIAVIVGLIGGFILGIALSSLIGIIGITVFNQAMGIKFLPYYTAVVCSVIVPIIEYKKGR